jgi:hypothetical protein
LCYVSWCHSKYEVPTHCRIFWFLRLGVVSLPCVWSWQDFFFIGFTLEFKKSFKIFPPNEHLHERSSGLPARGNDRSCGKSNLFISKSSVWDSVLKNSFLQFKKHRETEIFKIFYLHKKRNRKRKKRTQYQYHTQRKSIIAQLHLQGKLTTPRRENQKIRHENVILKAYGLRSVCVGTSDLTIDTKKHMCKSIPLSMSYFTLPGQWTITNSL